MSAVLTRGGSRLAAAVGPEQVEAMAEGALAGLATVLEPSALAGSRADWAGAVGSLQRVIDVATAVQDAAIVRLAAIEPEYLEDGTLVESHRAPGHVALDAPSIVSGVLSTSQLHAERRVEAAVLLAADGPEGSDTDSGLGGLHVAMGQGRLDAYRASVIADELAGAPPQVRETVVTMLDGHFEVEDGAHLRRRCRRALARISPELLVERAQQARAQCGLRRWVAEPGVDRWEGTFPSEDAATAWAAVDALAQRYVKDGVCTHIEAARGKALTDLVAGQATIDTVLTVTVPATALPGRMDEDREPADSPQTRPATDADDLVEVTGPAGNQPVFVSRAWITAMATPRPRPGPRVKGKAPTPSPDREFESEAGSNAASGSWSPAVHVAPCHPDTGALVDPAVLTQRDPGHEQRSTVTPNPAVEQQPPIQEGARLEPNTSLPHPNIGQGTPDGDARVSGAEPRSETVVPTRIDTAAGGFGAGAYRPSASVAKRVKARDRRCRFPGCTVAAVFCDLDHVRPWPGGPTADTNLIYLCRRHHRVKQRPGWHVTLATDGTVTWTDPTRRVRTTAPADALTCTVLKGAATPPPAPTSTSTTLTALPDGPHSDLEFLLEHHIATVPIRCRGATIRAGGGDGRHRVELAPSTDVIRLEHTITPCRRPRRGRPAFPDEPPF